MSLIYLLNIPALSVITLFIICFYKLLIYPLYICPLTSIPNAHWSASLAPFWILWVRYWNRENKTLYTAHLKHGSIIRVAPNELSINDVAGLRAAYAGGFEKGQWYSIFDNYGVPCMFSSWHSRPHGARKRMMSNIYSKSYLNTSPTFRRHCQVILYERLLPIINSTALSKSDNALEVHELWNATTMDFITAYLFGLKSGSNFLRDIEERRHWLSLYHSRKTHVYFPQELPRLTRALKSIGIHLVPTWVDDANQELEDWCKAHCDSATTFIENNSHYEDVGDKPLVLSTILTGIQRESIVKGDNSVLSSTTLKSPKLSLASEMIDQVAAGHETSGITLTYLTFHLSNDISLQDILRTELLGLSPPLSFPSSGQELPSFKDIDALPVLHAILMETLRLNPAIPGGQPRMSPYPSSNLNGYEIPGGVRVGAQAYNLHHDQDIFSNPDKWDYMRWMDEKNGLSEDQKKERDRNFWAFSSGGRMCVGSNFAMHELKITMAAIYTNFRTHIVDDEGIEQTDGYTAGPTSNKLTLRFQKVGDSS